MAFSRHLSTLPNISRRNRYVRRCRFRNKRRFSRTTFRDVRFFPATLLLDLQIGLASTLANESAGASATRSVPSRMTNVKMRAFITPGQTVELNAEKMSGDASFATYALGARVNGKVVASARVDMESTTAAMESDA